MTDQTRTPDLPSRLREMADLPIQLRSDALALDVLSESAEYRMAFRRSDGLARIAQNLRDAASALEAHDKKDELMRDGTALPSSTVPATASTDRLCVIGEYCREHRFVHGAEAEELREHIEAFINERPRASIRDLQAVLDDVDARDSCAFQDRAARRGDVAGWNACQGQARIGAGYVSCVLALGHEGVCRG